MSDDRPWLRISWLILLVGALPTAGCECSLESPVVHASRGEHFDRVVLEWNEVEGAEHYLVEVEDPEFSVWIVAGSTCETDGGGQGCDTPAFEYRMLPGMTHDDLLSSGGPVGALSPGKKYRFRVTAVFNAETHTEPSVPVAGWTRELEAPDLRMLHFDRYVDHEPEVGLAWSAVDGADEYRVLMAFDEQENWEEWDWGACVEEPASDRCHTGRGDQTSTLVLLPDADRYFYAFRIQAIRSDMEYFGPASNVVHTSEADIPGLSPPLLAATRGEYPDRVVLTWTEPLNAAAYVLERRRVDEDRYSLLEDEIILPEYVDQDVDLEAHYHYRVSARHQWGWRSHWSESATGWASDDRPIVWGGRGIFPCVGRAAIALASDMSHVACVHAGDLRAAVLRFEEEEWVELERASDSFAEEVTVAADSSSVYAAFVDKSASSAIRVRRLDRDGWMELGGGVNLEGRNLALGLVLGKPHVVVQTGSFGRATAKRFAGGEWETLGHQLSWSRDAIRSFVSSTTEGTVVLASSCPERAVFLEYAEPVGQWVEAAPELEKSEAAVELLSSSFAVGAGGALYFAHVERFEESGSDTRRLRVHRSLGGGDWTSILEPIDQVRNVALASYDEGFWMAWTHMVDGGQSYSLRNSRWDGEDWLHLGGLHADESPQSLDLALTADGVPRTAITVGSEEPPHFFFVISPVW